jgi:hypothetical protein
MVPMIKLAVGAAGALLAVASAAIAQQTFPTPQAAAEALVDSVARHDGDAVARVLGKRYELYLPVPQTTSDDVTKFLEAWALGRRIVPAGDAKAWLEVGRFGWTLPIPIVRRPSGWSFDVSATADELRARRIGRNELDAIQVMRAYVDAQDDYKAGEGRGRYATRLVARPGQRDGLYWPSASNATPSPLGPYVARGEPYAGYRFRQIAVTDGPATGSLPVFVGWPDKWDDTGVKTFVVGSDGIVRQKDLGPQSAARARAISSYSPDDSWQKVD